MLDWLTPAIAEALRDEQLRHAEENLAGALTVVVHYDHQGKASEVDISPAKKKMRLHSVGIKR